jgi:hypothetical protein
MKRRQGRPPLGKRPMTVYERQQRFWAKKLGKTAARRRREAKQK